MELTVYSERLFDIVDPDARPEKLAGGFTFTEGPAKRGDDIYFTDFPENRIYVFRNGKAELVSDDSRRTIGLTCTRDGRLIGCASDLHAIRDIETGEILADSFFGRRFNGTNDVIEDSHGRLWFSDPYVREYEGPGLHHSFFFRLEKGEVTPVTFDLPWPNGLALSPDEQTLYLIDSRRMQLLGMGLANGSLRVIAQWSKGMGPGLPDGMRVRADGTIFVAGPGGISVLSREGRLLGILRMPEIAANLCFDEGGLFVTASTSVYHLPLR